MATKVNNKFIEVWNGTSFVPFSGIIKSNHTKFFEILFSDYSILKCSVSHRIKIKSCNKRGQFQSKFIKAEKILGGEVTSNGLTIISIKKINDKIKLYDLSDVECHEYFTNSIISHNCEFLSSDPLLIKSITLQGLRESNPLFIDKGFSFWKEPEGGKTYLIGADVAEGVNQDFSTIQILELESMEQIAEFRNNAINESQFYNAIKYAIEKVLSYKDRNGQQPIVYWSFENNSVGASIGTMYYNDEKFPTEAILISGKGERIGFRTVNKPKLESCRHLKNLVEKTNNNLKIKSRTLIFELKNYIAHGASYAAKHGATDDLISAMLIVMRILKQLSEYEPEVFEKLYKAESDFYDEHNNQFEEIEPMPFII